MKNVYILQVVAQISPLVGAEDPKRQTDECPYMNGAERSAEMMTDIMHLGMAVMAAGNAVIGAGGHDLVEFDLAVVPAGFSETGLQEAAATTATVVVRLVRRHLDNVFRTDHRLNDKAQIVGNDIAEAFSDDLAGVLYSECDFALLVPVGADFKPSFPDPFGVVTIDGSNFKFVVDIEFFQSGPD
ncbi:MAG: hypothetical protein VR65_23060 [Desulfobulbaceae bacterium BRH_c16a]|nr:MAG: hypothetical protein VR65_23060 [Desulfobulbaceae bacterium BRH_c16a]